MTFQGIGRKRPFSGIQEIPRSDSTEQKPVGGKDEPRRPEESPTLGGRKNCERLERRHQEILTSLRYRVACAVATVFDRLQGRLGSENGVLKNRKSHLGSIAVELASAFADCLESHPELTPEMFMDFVRQEFNEDTGTGFDEDFHAALVGMMKYVFLLESDDETTGKSIACTEQSEESLCDIED